jgi:hypothetical protein
MAELASTQQAAEWADAPLYSDGRGGGRDGFGSSLPGRCSSLIAHHCLLHGFGRGGLFFVHVSQHLA